MSNRRLAAKTGVYQKDGQEKGEYVNLGVILSGNNGEYMLLDPAVNLAGVLTKQNLLAHSMGKKPRTNVIVSVFDDSQQQQQQQQPQNNQQQNQQGANSGQAEYDSDIPF